LVVPICALLAHVVIFNLAAGLLLKFRTVDIQFASSHKPQSREDASAGKEVMQVHNNGEKVITRVDVDLINYGLEIHKRSLRGHGTNLRVLKGVNARFEAGQLNVILGRAYFHCCFHSSIKS
jgi:hypothetical protein